MGGRRDLYKAGTQPGPVAGPAGPLAWAYADICPDHMSAYVGTGESWRQSVCSGTPYM